jgi:hypothetical protein
MLVAFGVLLPCEAARAQDGIEENVNYSKYSVFRIPYNTDSSTRLKQIQLYVSTDKGVTWRQVMVVAPDQRYFEYRAQTDGLYWFAVRTVDLENRTYPITMDNVRPGLKVLVDTQPPAVRLRGLPSRDGEVGVEWEVRDDNLLPNGVRLDYRLPGASVWMPLMGDLPPTGQKYWRPTSNGSVEVRLHADDRAGNVGEDRTTVAAGGTVGQNYSNPSDSVVPKSADPAVRLVNSKRIALNYEIKDKGPSGVSTIELWYTQDPAGRKWSKYMDKDGKAEPPFVVEVSSEGLFGFTLVVRSGVGLGDRPPQVGDRPQMWVEVDLTKPVVRLGNVDVGRGADTGRLTINWTASDKNIAPQPITISYAEKAGGTWKPIASNIENTGRYVWQMPADVPYEFLVRVEAADRAGNVGADETTRPVIVDLNQPKGIIVNVEAAPK